MIVRHIPSRDTDQNKTIVYRSNFFTVQTRYRHDCNQFIYIESYI